ncbi:MAG TPA: GntR family transcriptional regulator [Rhizomicrobium sp.]|jgi:DNA-binding GntR family transcriptional regulator|nr:GntR family transcriptional regulator [Rhizomicrobium sp.]
MSAIRDMAERQIARPSGLAEEVYRRIRADIMSLKLPPDSRVSVDSLARELGVSQTPIREALSMLEANGLVSKKHFAGYQTAPRMDRAQLDALFEFRLLIEPHAARKAAGAMAEADMALLESGARAPSHDAFADMDTAFHKMIAEGAGNPLIADSLARLHIHIHIFRSCFKSEIAKEAVHEHDDVIAAIRSRDGDAAEAAMRRHIERSYGRLRDFIKE